MIAPPRRVPPVVLAAALCAAAACDGGSPAGGPDPGGPAGGTSHGLTIPPGHPRLWFDAERLARARSWFQAHPFTPAADDPLALATRGLLADEAAPCRAALDWALETTTTRMPMTGVACDNCRWYGEAIVLAYDWCHDRMTPAERSAFIAATNGWMDHWRQAAWGGVPAHHSNYYWGYLRNELEWAIASYDENVAMAEVLLDDVFVTRLQDDFGPATLADLRGGVGQEGTQYGAYPGAYVTVPFTTAGLLGRDVLGATSYWREAVYAYVYSLTPAPTTYAGRTVYTFFPWSDDEQWLNGAQVGPAKSNFMTAAAMHWEGTGVGQHARQWLALTGGTRDRFVAAVDPGGTARPFDALPLDYHAAGPGYVWGRSGWGPQATTFLLQLGEAWSNGHAHVDWGTWQLWRRGRFLSRESTSYGETIAGPGGVGTVPASLAEGHNALLVGGEGPRDDPWISGAAVVRRLESRPDYLYAAVDLTGTAAGSHGNARIVHWEREFLFVRALETLVILDRVESAGGSDVKTFLAHCETAPVLGAQTATCTNGDQALVLTALAPAATMLRAVVEGGAIGQHRIEVDAPAGQTQTHILTVLQARDAGAAGITPSLAESSGAYTLTLDGANAMTFEKGMVSAGGTITTPAGTRALATAVQGMAVTDEGPVWE